MPRQPHGRASRGSSKVKDKVRAKARAIQAQWNARPQARRLVVQEPDAATSAAQLPVPSLGMQNATGEQVEGPNGVELVLLDRDGPQERQGDQHHHQAHSPEQDARAPQQGWNPEAPARRAGDTALDGGATCAWIVTQRSVSLTFMGGSSLALIQKREVRINKP